MWMQPSCCSEASVKFIPVCYNCCCQSVIWIKHRASPSLLRAPTRASVGRSMRLRGLFDLPSNLSTGQWDFEVPLQIYLRLHEVSGSPWHSFKIIYGSCRGFIDPPSHASAGPWNFAVSLTPPADLFAGQWSVGVSWTLPQIYLRVMRFRSLLDPPVNLSTGPWGFGVSFQIYLRLHEVSGSPWHSFKIIYGSCRGLMPYLILLSPWYIILHFQFSSYIFKLCYRISS